MHEVGEVAGLSLSDAVIALFSFVSTDKGVGIRAEKHYRLVAPESMSAGEWESYREKLRQQAIANPD